MNYPQRKLPRLGDYDYSAAGAYFITICTQGKQCVLGKIISDNRVGEAHMEYSRIGEIAKQCLLEIESHYDNVRIDNWVIMPNHVHILLRLSERINPFPTIRCDIPNIIGKYKASVTRTVGREFQHSAALWQKSFHDHVIRNEKDYLKIWQYIAGNPSKWADDCFYCR